MQTHGLLTLLTDLNIVQMSHTSSKEVSHQPVRVNPRCVGFGELVAHVK